MNNTDRLVEILGEKLAERGVESDQRYCDRLAYEWEDVVATDKEGYFLDLYDREARFAENENNAIVPWLLGLCEDYDVTRPPKVYHGDNPDIDTDIHPKMLGYIKTDFIPRVFGADNVCAISNYNTFGIRTALIDMARVFGADRNEVQNVTKNLEVKDEDGKVLTWETALKINKDFAQYCLDHPDIAEAARKMVGRNRSRGKHAGGVIISRIPLADFAPLVSDAENNRACAWTEGLHAQDLQPVGLVKYDFLGLATLEQIAVCVKMIKERHPEVAAKGFFARPGMDDFTDESYLNDPKAIALANQAKLKGVFQFDSHGIREMVRAGGVADFNDLVTYNGLYRPGPIGMNMHTAFIKRKKGQEEYDVHPKLRAALGWTYGVLVFQEQVMQVLNIVGEIPLKDCYQLIKAISKKKEKIFAKYRDMFLTNGQRVLGWTLERVQNLWDQIAQFAEYGFNLSHSTAYAYNAMRQLALKAHFPLEFFASLLACEEKNENLKEYKLEAEKFGLDVLPVEINKSRIKFDIIDDRIYAGIANIKGIGEEVAQRIVEGYVYASYDDFLDRFGADANVLKPFCGLRLFKEADPVTLYEFSEHYKSETKKRLDRDKRAVAGQQKIMDELRFLMPEEHKNDASLAMFLEWALRFDTDKEFYKSMEGPDGQEQIPGLDAKEAWKKVKKYRSNVENLRKKQALDEPILLRNFRPKGQIDKELRDIFEGDPEAAQQHYYGFAWSHMLERSPDYRGDRTFDCLVADVEECGHKSGPVEVQVVAKPREIPFKSGKGSMWVVQMEDANGRLEEVKFWKDDYERFAPELNFWESKQRRGNLLRIRVEPPKPPFKGFTFESPPRHLRNREIPQDKAQDWRLIVLERPPVEAPPQPAWVCPVCEPTQAIDLDKEMDEEARRQKQMDEYYESQLGSEVEMDPYDP